MAQTRRAVARQDWQQVEELTARATAVSQLVDEKHEELALAVYAASVEIAAQFSLHPYVTSGGTRYLPLVADTEFGLIEDFPEEGGAEGTELLSLLGLTARRGLSRMEIERALREHGERVMRERLGPAGALP